MPLRMPVLVPFLTPLCAAPARCYVASINEKGLYDYLLINDDLDEAVSRLAAIAARAAAGQPAEAGMVPERVVLEDVSEDPDMVWQGWERSGFAAAKQGEARSRWRSRRAEGCWACGEGIGFS